MQLLNGQQAIVTGAAQGIGLSIVRRLAAHGANVVLWDLGADRVEAATRSLRDEGHLHVVGAVVDVTDEEAVAAAIGQVVAEYGRLDTFVNCAGITRDSMMHRMSLEDFQAVIEVNLTGTWIGTKHALTVMRGQETGGSIVNLSSISGKVGNLGQTNYSASKSGVVGLTKAAAKEGARAGVRVNAVLPGLIRTQMVDDMPPEVVEQRMAEIPLGRIGEPDDVADAVVFFASAMSSYITGTTLEITGGRHL